MMELIVVTGMAGAGKTCAMDALEDIGYYVVENLPLFELREFALRCLERDGRFARVAAVVDIRSCDRYSELAEAYRAMKKELHDEVRCRLLCMEASEAVLLKRFRTMRRIHPLAKRFEGDLTAAIRYEQSHLQPLRASADFMLDSSNTSVSELKDQIKNLFMPHITDAMTIQVMSFGFKHGAPLEADLVYDMRCLPNPYYVEELKEHTGVEACVQEYVMDSEDSREYLERVLGMLRFLIPLYIREGRTQLVVAFGCTGGRHRSVTFAELVSKALREDGLHIFTHHRDYQKHRK
ncbi:MAG: RNase adapter RapZ [Oscillospiraceae bacterium]|nr:RNase adapter RapZ [Oscillospiraceae bacterium]